MRCNPVRVGSYPDGFSVDISGNHAYLTAGFYDFEVIDVGNTTKPIRVGGYGLPGVKFEFETLYRDVAVSGNYAYVADGIRGFQVMDISNPANPILVGNRTG